MHIFYLRDDIIWISKLIFNKTLYLKYLNKNQNWPSIRSKKLVIYRMDKQWGPTVWHKELYSIPCDKP